MNYIARSITEQNYKEEVALMQKAAFKMNEFECNAREVNCIEGESH